MGAPVTVAKTDIADRERILDELRRHLGVAETGGEASLTVVVRGVRLEVNLRATKVHTGTELADLRAQMDALMVAEPWRIGNGSCGRAATRKVSAFSRRNSNCTKPITGAVLYRWTDVLNGKCVARVSAWLHCTHHEHSHGFDTAKVVGVLALSKADVKRYLKQYADHTEKTNERRRIEQLTAAVNL